MKLHVLNFLDSLRKGDCKFRPQMQPTFFVEEEKARPALTEPQSINNHRLASDETSLEVQLTLTLD